MWIIPDPQVFLRMVTRAQTVDTRPFFFFFASGLDMRLAAKHTHVVLTQGNRCAVFTAAARIRKQYVYPLLDFGTFSLVGGAIYLGVVSCWWVGLFIWVGAVSCLWVGLFIPVHSH